ncbi:acetate--CoA ligase [Fervidibacter sacchari]|uniref:Acetyltransferase n=1 Tax=Candidatus Fervidibacter sacchari TaxID=1448929 RepID=A0ABT2EV07_9BACT|nr:acetate--CoA ligase [Candidatus Fervidibacter sacchari]MCS3920755.1 acetyltransferase [Candidatus Fervidibacter sacchari]WKU16279.1 acetate--CoA ligase [Candidatus Fervidibacter sacchari]
MAQIVAEREELFAGLHDLRPILEPQSVAVIGASRQPGTVGYAVLSNLLMGQYTGIVYPVNPKAKAICGVRTYPSVLEIPDPVDLAVIIVRAPLVPQVLEECGQKGVKGAIVISAGFKETGPEGAKLEAQVREIAHHYGIALVGPNCLGVINTDPNYRLNASFAKEMPLPGNIAFISQSGALCTAVLDYAKGQGIGFSKVVSLGNKADVNENDFLAYLWQDPQTQVILLYIEELSDGRRFLQLAREITGEGDNRKPILALKAGRTPAGARAVASHTGSLAGSDEVYEALFAQAGVLRADTVEDLFEYAIAFANQPLPNGRRTVIITNAGGPGIMATDACVRYGLELAQLNEKTLEQLRQKLPPHASLLNPIDLIGDAQHDRYEAALDAVLDDPNVDAVIVLLTPQAMTDIENIANVIVQKSKQRVKPILACFMGLVDISAGVNILKENGVPCYSFPEDAVRALAAMVKYVDWVRRPRTGFKMFPVDTERARNLLSKAPVSEHGFIPEEVAFQVLEAYGFPVLPWGVVKTPEEAVSVARQIGYPVVLKVLSPDIVHKFDVGGVQLNLNSDSDVKQAFEKIINSVKQHLPEARIEGVIVQAMAKKGREVILGLKRDPQFGPILMFGLGGIYVEVLRDVTFRFAPVRELGAYRMVRDIRTYKLLEGVRGEPPADIDKIVECIERLSQLAIEQDLIEELDINPLIVYPQGEGAVVVDVRIMVRR